eukprot:gene5004-5120_t
MAVPGLPGIPAVAPRTPSVRYTTGSVRDAHPAGESLMHEAAHQGGWNRHPVAGPPGPQVYATLRPNVAGPGDVEAIRSLAQLGVDLDGADEHGATPCHLAARAGHVVALSALAELGADTGRADGIGATPIVAAAAFGHAAAIDLLASLGADVAAAT